MRAVVSWFSGWKLGWYSKNPAISRFFSGKEARDHTILRKVIGRVRASFTVHSARTSDFTRVPSMSTTRTFDRSAAVEGAFKSVIPFARSSQLSVSALELPQA